MFSRMHGKMDTLLHLCIRISRRAKIMRNYRKISASSVRYSVMIKCANGNLTVGVESSCNPHACKQL